MFYLRALRLMFYFFPFGVNIIKFNFLMFKESLLVWNDFEIFLFLCLPLG